MGEIWGRSGRETAVAEWRWTQAFPATPTTAPYPGPTLFIGGADSNYISAKHTDAIERLFPQASVTHVAGAGHFVHVDQPAAVCELIADFIQES